MVIRHATTISKRRFLIILLNEIRHSIISLKYSCLPKFYCYRTLLKVCKLFVIQQSRAKKKDKGKKGKNRCLIINFISISGNISHIIRVFCPRAGISLQIQEPRIQFCPKAGLLPHLGTKVAVFYRLIGAVASHCFPHPTLSLTSDRP